jgi:hypothetical protein
MDGYPDEFSFAASCSGAPTRLDGPHPFPPDPGWHVHSGGGLDHIVITACSLGAIVAYYMRRSHLP